MNKIILLKKEIFLFVVISFASKPAESVCNERCHKCDENTDTCKECRYGWYGYDCSRKCENCWVSGCNEIGVCDQCKPGRYRQGCGSLCPRNCRADGNGDVFCHRESGECLDGCKLGWWGDTCNRRCNQHCDDKGCLQGNGHCIGHCPEGIWGLKCEKICSEGCFNRRCGIVNGNCLDGCKMGLSGPKCSKPIDCHNNNYTQGDSSDRLRKCRGCKPGWTSTYCNERCPSGCQRCHQFSRECFKCNHSLYGRECTQECSENCKDYECDMQGRCTKGCRDGFTGPTCTETCPFRCLKCHQEDNSCKKCKTGWTGPTCENEQREALELSIKELTGKGVILISAPATVAICLFVIWILFEVR